MEIEERAQLLGKLEKLHSQINVLTFQIAEELSAIQRVRELHSQEVRVDKTTGKDFETGFCGHCWSYNGEYDTPYPCPTIKALDGEL